MEKPGIPVNESERLNALKRLEILDSLPEQAYDNITKLASQICGTPIALVSLVDENRQWFKSKVGLSANETHRDISFCGHAIVAEVPIFQVVNAKTDIRFFDNPLVTDSPKIAFYAGATLRTSDGYMIGTLCVIDTKPKELNPEQLEGLRMLADQVQFLVEARHAEKVARDAKIETEDLKAKLVSSLNASHLSVSILEGPDLRYSFVNKSHGQYFGGKKNVIGLPLAQAIPEIANQGIIDKLLDVYETGESYTAKAQPLTFIQSDGLKRTFYLNYNFQPLKLSSGKIIGVISTSEDVTEKVETAQLIRAINDKSESTEALLNQAVSLAKIGFYDWDIVTGGYTISEQFRLDWGLKAGAQITDAFDAIVDEDKEKVRTLVEKAIAENAPYRAEYRVKRPDGKIRCMEVLGKVQYAKDGTPTRFFGTSLDITERRASEALLANEKFQLDQIMEKSPAAMATWIGDDLIFDRVNPPYQNLFGKRQLIGLPLLEACPELKGQGFENLLRDVMKTGKPFEGHEVLAKISPELGAEPEDRYFTFSYVPIYNTDGKAYGVYDHSIEVTETVLSRQKIEAGRRAAEAANIAKSQFLANMSHEIRSPLSAIMGFADLLRSHGITTDEAHRYINVIDRNSKHLLRIIDDILDLSKVEAGMLTLENFEFSLADHLTEFSSMMSFKAKEKGIHFELKIDSSIPDRVIADPTRLRQILNNVLSNAIKFTSKGKVELVVSYTDEVLTLMCIDTGIGISDDQLEKLFTPFQQADPTTARKFGGTGLGLVLTRKICETMGGTFQLETSRIGFGSTFKATVKIQPSSNSKMFSLSQINSSLNQKTRQEKQPSGLLSGTKILVIEDSPDNQILISFLLTKQGAQVEMVENGLEGVKKALSQDYDLVMCDMQMPHKDGYETVAELRSLGYKVPIIALTAHAMKEERAKALSVGFDEYLTKPIQKDELFSTIKKFLH